VVESVRHGPARVTFSGDVTRAHGFIDKALHLLYQTQERARVGGLSVLSKSWRLDDDSYAYAIIAGGMQAVHIVAGEIGSEPAQHVVPAKIPDFLSGVVQNGFVDTIAATRDHPAFKQMDRLHPTQRDAAAYKIPFGYQGVRRLAVEPWGAFSDLRNLSESGIPIFSQYTKLKPTMYSGRMRQVVQAIMGFGRQRRSRDGKREVSRYDTLTSAVRTTQPQPPSTRYEKDVSSAGLQVRYDWSFSRTHGITVASDGKLWLVEIGVNRGVSAMPLPLNARTTSATFRDKLDAIADADGLALLDAFGGFPTGEAFPGTGASFDSWVRAGRTLRLIDHAGLNDFYSLSGYSSQMGWAFNLRGDEAHNTGYYMGNDGVQRGAHYMVSLSIGASTAIHANASADTLRTAFEAARKKYPDIIDAAIYKLDRLTPTQLTGARSRAGSSIDAAITYVDAIVLAPIAPGAAALHRISEGYLWFPPRAKVGVNIKFPEPLLGLLVSHNMQPAWDTGSDKRCDTTVHVFFAGDELKWVKFFRDPRSVPGQDSNDYEQCMYQGAWSDHTDSGALATVDTFYTNDLDDRAEFAGTTTDTTVIGTSLGYCRITVNDDIIFPAIGDSRRVKRYAQTIKTTSVTHARIAAAVAVPFFDREAYYYSVSSSHEGRSTSIGHGYQELFDPWWCNYWHNFPGLTGRVSGGVFFPGQHPDGCGPVLYRSAASPSPNYEQSDCGDDADSGPWCFVCDDLDAMVYSIPLPPTPPGDFTFEPATNSYVVTLVNSTQFSPLTTHFQQGSWNPWPLFTPDVGDGFSEDQYIETTSNAFGAADSMRYGIDLNTGNTVVGLPNWPEMSTPSWLTYIGVIDGE